MRIALAAALLAASALAAPHATAASLVNTLVIPGDATDPSGLTGGPNANRLGGFFSDLYFDRPTGTYYGLADRGPGGGVITYQTRVQRFGLTVNPTTGAISGFTPQTAPLFRDNLANFNGLNPRLLNGNAGILGRSLDPEGFVLARNGNFFVSDEYGPSVKEFRPDGTLVRTFTTPSNLLPRDSSGNLNFVDNRSVITTGRQDNRGFEGLAISPDGSKLYAMLQDPLVNEGASNDGRRSRNLRIVQFDTATGNATAQFIYQLEDRADINSRIPGTSNDFTATQQGRNIGISAIIALNDTQFLVLERDNRGVGVEDATGAAPVGSKRVFQIDIAGATDVSAISLAGANSLPSGVTPVSKTLVLDIAAELTAAGQIIPEKFEGLTIGPRLTSGLYSLLIGTDNDFSVTQTGGGTQFDVCSDGTQVAIGSACPSGAALIPSFLYAFTIDLPGYVPQLREVPAPAALGLFGAGLLGLMALRRRPGAPQAA